MNHSVPHQDLTLPQAVDLAVQYQQNGNPGAAENLLRQVLSHRPEHAEALHLTGVICHQRGDTVQARQLILKAIQSVPTEGLYYSNLAEMCRLLGDLQDAIRYGHIAIKLSPLMASAHSNLGLAYYDSEDYPEARRHQQQALSLVPDFAPALNNLASISRQLNQREVAAGEYRHLLSLHPHYPEAMNNLGATLSELERFDEALEILRRTVKLQPDYAEAHCNLGTVLLGLEHFQQAIESFETALLLKQPYPDALLGLAKVCQENHQLSQAEAFARQALQTDQRFVPALITLAAVLIEAGRSPEAEVCLNKVLQTEPDCVDALNFLATIMMERGEIDTAKALFNQTVCGDQQQDLAAHLAITQVQKMQADDPHFIALRIAYRNIAQLPRKKRIALNFALGKSCDDQGQAAEAFNYFADACREKRQTLTYSADYQSAYTDRIKACFDHSFCNREMAQPGSGITPIFILGMPRSGTTLTEQIIASHPLVYGAGELSVLGDVADSVAVGSEGSVFPESILAQDRATLQSLGERYLTALQQQAGPASFITDKMPSNFHYIGLIKAILPQAKVIHVKRNPLDTCLSCFTKHFNNGQIFSYDLVELGRYYRDYASLMEHWRQVLTADAFYEIQYEDLIADSESQSRALIEYCGLPWDDACLSPHKTKRSIRTASVTQVRQPIYTSSVTRWRAYEEQLQPLRQILGDLAGADAVMSREPL